mmetsp:Transcript_27666/g.58457  ORF Transcript_27666/g.58457 Transcript_27666/m.58457 type:complete len:85 (+) Transcript_27666:82-336(+)
MYPSRKSVNPMRRKSDSANSGVEDKSRLDAMVDIFSVDIVAAVVDVASTAASVGGIDEEIAAGAVIPSASTTVADAAAKLLLLW